MQRPAARAGHVVVAVVAGARVGRGTWHRGRRRGRGRGLCRCGVVERGQLVRGRKRRRRRGIRGCGAPERPIVVVGQAADGAKGAAAIHSTAAGGGGGSRTPKRRRRGARRAGRRMARPPLIAEAYCAEGAAAPASPRGGGEKPVGGEHRPCWADVAACRRGGSLHPCSSPTRPCRRRHRKYGGRRGAVGEVREKRCKHRVEGERRAPTRRSSACCSCER